MLCNGAIKHQDVQKNKENQLLVLFLANLQYQSITLKNNLLTIIEDNLNHPQSIFSLISIDYR